MTVSALRHAAAPGSRRVLWLDGALAAAVLAASLAHTHRDGAVGIILDVALVLPLLARRRAPLAVFSLIWAVAAVQGLVERPTLAVSALLIAFYTVATGPDRRRTALAALALELGIVLTAITTSTGVESAIRIFVALSGLATAAGVLGVNVRNRRLMVSGLRERAERLEHEREHEVALARVTERARIAREMHDVVAHNLSVMVALCDGAAYQIRDAPERVEAALEQASRTGRQALGEMRHLLGVLRDAPEGADFAPQPGLRQIEDLVEQIRHAGVPVSYTLSGALPAAPAGLELALYRIVQEALTNTLKHAGEGATAQVTLRCREDRVDIAVRDTGVAPAAPAGAGGSGLRGMRERAAVYGGSLHAGPHPEGGWQVRASLAVPAPAPAAA